MARGGKRPGAGRPPGSVNRKALIGQEAARAILEGIHQERFWTGLINGRDRKLAFEAMRYLTDRVHGRPSQAINAEVGGEFRISWLKEPV